MYQIYPANPITVEMPPTRNVVVRAVGDRCGMILCALLIKSQVVCATTPPNVPEYFRVQTLTLRDALALPPEF